MADQVAVISVVASSTVAIAAVAAQIWQGHLTRESERASWLRDRRAEAYIAVLRLFEKTPEQVAQEEWEYLMARVHAFASPRIADLFRRWGDASRLTWQDAPADVRERANQEATSLQREIETSVASELQAGARSRTERDHDH